MTFLVEGKEVDSVLLLNGDLIAGSLKADERGFTVELLAEAVVRYEAPFLRVDIPASVFEALAARSKASPL